MLAARVQAPGVIVAGDAPEPVVGDGQVLVRTAVASLCGSDLHVVDAPLIRQPMPWGHPGHEAIGEVIEPGSSNLTPGERVLCVPPAASSAAFAERQVLDPRYVIPLPETAVPGNELLMAQQLGTVIFAARRSAVEASGGSAVVIGLGSAGVFWCAWLRRNGAARVVGIDPSARRRAVAERLGCDVTVDPGAGDTVTMVADVLGSPGGDIVVEAVGHGSTTQASIDLAAMDAELVWFGLPSGDGSVSLSYASYFRKRLTAHATYGAQDEPLATSFNIALDLIASRAIDVRPLLSHTIPLSSIDEAFALARDPVASGAVKVTVVPT